MKKTLLFLLFLSFFKAFSQPAIQWQHTIGGDSLDYLYLAEQTTDGGYILGGASRSNIAGEKTEGDIGWFDYWLVKTDSMGIIQWQNTIGGDSDDVLRCVHQTADGGYILGGYSYSDISGDKTDGTYGGSDFWVVKTDSLGNIQWQKTIGGSLSDNLRSIIQTLDGGYLMGGESNSHPSGNKTVNTHGGNDYWTVKIDSLGAIQWQFSHGGTNEDLLYSVIQTTDGGYLQGGYSRSNANGDKTVGTNGNDDYWLIKTDSVGTMLWQKNIGGSDYDQLQDMQQTADGGFILGGYSQSNISGDKTQSCRGWYDYWVVKTNSAGVIQWQSTIGGDSVDYMYSVRQTSDHGYIIGGSSTSHVSGDKTTNTFGGSDYWVVRLDSVGAIQWQKQLGGTLNDIARTVSQTTDGGYLVGGDAYSGTSGNKTEQSRGFNDYWLVKINHELRVTGYHVADVLCHGDTTGVAVAVATGGAPPYTYDWLPSGGSNDTAYLAAGTYSCHVTDAGGGTTFTAQITITEPPALTSAITSHTNPLCNGGTGDAVVVASGGTGAFTYAWSSSPVQTTDTAVNLHAGAYTVTVTDANGCISRDTVTITQPPVINVGIVAHTNVTCHGGNNGNAKAVAFGGTGALTYSWNTVPPQSQPTANALTAGTYTVTVTDAVGCSNSVSVTITEPPLLIPYISSQTNVTPCPGGSNGSAVVAAGGGTPPYTYTWSTVPVQHTDTISNLSAGSYTATVLDANGCISATIATITDPAPITPVFTVASPVCGNNNGSVAAAVSNGTPPYSYLWNTGSTTNAVTGLDGQPADTLTLIVTDVNNCADTSSVILTCRTCSLQVALSVPVDSCPMSAMTLTTSSTTVVGSCGLNVPTAIAPDGAACPVSPDDTLNCPVSNLVYAYLTSPSCLDSVITCSTIESVYISLDSIAGTPSRACGNDNRLWLRSPQGTLLLLIDQKPLNADTTNHYKPTFTPAGTLGPVPNVNGVSYNGVGYAPDGGSLCSSFTGESLYASNGYATALGLGAGTWIAYMNDMDSLGCSNFARITEFCITFHNASNNLSYAWSSTNNCNLFLSDTTVANPQFNIPSGIYDCTYIVTISDSCGCSGSDSVRIHCTSPLTVDEQDAENTFTIQPNPAHDSFTIRLNEKMQNAELKIYDMTGREVHQQIITSAHQHINSQLSTVNCQLNSGLYFVKLTAEGRVHTKKLVIE